MPHGNRVSSSSALKMTGIWTNTIGYDPYAAEEDAGNAEDEANAFEQAQGLMALAKLSNKGVSCLFVICSVTFKFTCRWSLRRAFSHLACSTCCARSLLLCVLVRFGLAECPSSTINVGVVLENETITITTVVVVRGTSTN